VRLIVAVCCVAIQVVPLSAAADTYPSRPIRLLVGYPAGGAVDLLARVVGERIGQRLGQAVVVEDRPGATGNIAATLLANSPPDGYTLYVGTSINAVSLSLFKKLSYDPVRDFAPITQTVEAQTILVEGPSLRAKSFHELIALAKASPGKITYASTGDGSTPHLAAVMYSNLAGIKMLHVPYKGGPPAVTDLLAGRVDITFSNPVSVMPQIKSGALHPLAVLGPKRFAELPLVPTMDEEGFKGFDLNPWYAIFAPAKTPPAIIERLHAAIVKSVEQPDARKILALQGLEVKTGTPQELTLRLKADIANYAALLKDAGVAPQ
jgi:tripartite-type tricarboxylate transporter receptor subunit TctC